MVDKAKRMALRHQLAKGGDRVIVMAGVPFGTAGSTNVLHVVRLIGDELDRYKALARQQRAAPRRRFRAPGTRPGRLFLPGGARPRPCSQTAQSKALSGSAPRARRPPTIPASTSPLPDTPSPGAPPVVGPDLPVRGDDVARATPLTRTTERIALRRAQAAADRIGFDLRLIAVEQRGQLVLVGQQDGRCARAARVGGLQRLSKATSSASARLARQQRVAIVCAGRACV